MQMHAIDWIRTSHVTEQLHSIMIDWWNSLILCQTKLNQCHCDSVWINRLNLSSDTTQVVLLEYQRISLPRLGNVPKIDVNCSWQQMTLPLADACYNSGLLCWWRTWHITPPHAFSTWGTDCSFNTSALVERTTDQWIDKWRICCTTKDQASCKDRKPNA